MVDNEASPEQEPDNREMLQDSHDFENERRLFKAKRLRDQK